MKKARLSSSASDVADLRTRLALARGAVGKLKYVAKDITGKDKGGHRKERRRDEYDTRSQLLKALSTAKHKAPLAPLGARPSLEIARDLCVPSLAIH